jgi:sec-independent protein translocase protein TatB
VGIGGPEVLVILLVALLVFGPKSLPGVARGLGKGMRDLRRLATEFQREVNLADAHEREAARKPANGDLPDRGPQAGAPPAREAGPPPGPPGR